MDIEKKNTFIVLIAGKARSGKGEVAKILEREFLSQGKRVVISPYTKYLKRYIYEITGEYSDGDDKPRDMLQNISSDIIKGKLNNKDFFINRQLEDLAFYSYFMDIVIIPDVRFEEELSVIKENYPNSISIGIKRKNYISTLTKKQQEDITEIALDNYKDYDYLIENTSLDNLNNQVINIIDKLKKEGKL